MDRLDKVDIVDIEVFVDMVHKVDMETVRPTCGRNDRQIGRDWLRLAQIGKKLPNSPVLGLISPNRS